MKKFQLIHNILKQDSEDDPNNDELKGKLPGIILDGTHSVLKIPDYVIVTI